MNPIPPLSLAPSHEIDFERAPRRPSLPVSLCRPQSFHFLISCMAVARRGAAWAWRGQYLFRRVGVSSSVAAQRKDMAIMNSIKQLRRIYTIPSCPLSLLLDGRLLLHSCGGNASSPLLFYDFYIAVLLYSRKWKVRKKGDTRVGRRTPPFRVGPGRADSVSPSLPPSFVRPGSGRYLRFDPEQPRKMISSPSAAPGGRSRRTRIQIRQEKGERGKRANHGGDGRLSVWPASLASSLSCPSSALTLVECSPLGGADLPDWELLGIFVVM